MKKRLITLFLSLILCFGAITVNVGCNTQKQFTVTFDRGDHPEATLAYGYEESHLVQTVTSWKELVVPVFICDSAYHEGWDKIISNIKSDITVTAKWNVKPFTVTFEPGAPDVTLIDGSESISVNNVNAIVPPKYERPGYTCSWDREFIESINDDAVVTPIWTPNEYKISFFDTDGTTPMYGDDFEFNVKYDQPITNLPIPEREGLQFAAWQKLDSQTIIYDGKIYDLTEDLSLRAVWVGPGEYLIIYENVEEINNATTYKTPTDEPIKINNPTKKGYEFLGWSGTDIEQTSLSVYIPVGATGVRTYTANWKAKEIGVALDADGGTLSTNRKTVVFGQKVGELPVPEKEGFTFIGWYTSNGNSITADTVWDIDDDSIQLKAKYSRIYTLKLILECTVRNKTVESKFDNESYLNGLGFIKEDDKTYVMKNIQEGDPVPVLPNPKPLDSSEYAFSSWKNIRGTQKITIKPGTPINEEKFPGSTETGEVILIAQCYALWTPFY